ncbi:MAG: hypothetical protein Q8R66_02050 [Methanobacteriaceae archaeon]|nr:hypothetical protein [Methanobacteriaceae archaeon]
MITIVFRSELGEILEEDDEDVLLDYEESLIKQGWIFQNPKSRLLSSTDKLLSKFSK